MEGIPSSSAGTFQALVELPLSRSVALWKGNQWQSVCPGVGGNVYTITVLDSTTFYIGGDFPNDLYDQFSNIAGWNGGCLISLGSGVTGTVLGVVPYSGNLIAGGNISAAGGISTYGMAKWNGISWSPLNVFTSISALSVHDSTLYAAWQYGVMRSTDGVNLYNVPGSIDDGGAPISQMATSRNGDLYITGSFPYIDTLIVNGIARWNGNRWSPLTSGGVAGLQTYPGATSLEVSGENVYAGGEFWAAGATPVTDIARWDGSNWNSFTSATAHGIGGFGVSVIKIAPNGDWYVGGSIYQAGKTLIHNIAHWNGTAWDSLGGGVSGDVQAIAFGLNGEVYVGGDFLRRNVVANNVAVWDGTKWISLGTDTANGVPGTLSRTGSRPRSCS